MEVDNRGVVYLCDGAQSKILKFSPELKTHCYSFGSYGAGINQFRHPRGMFIQDSIIAIIEEWTDDSGIQAYKERISIKELKTSKSVFDATEQEIKVSFRIDDYSSGAKVTIGDRGWSFTNLNPDTTYQITWDGRHNNGSLFLPGDYIVRLNLDEGAVKTISVTVKGTIKSGVLSPNEHWTKAGEPYVLTGDVQVPGGGRLTIDPGVKVMPTGNYGIISKYNNPFWHRLYAQGTALNKILFTPHRKLYPVPDSIPKGFWKGIDFHTANWEDSLIFAHCIIEGAGSDSAAFWVYMAKYVNLSNCEISKSGNLGFYCDYRCNKVLVNNCQFTDNDSIPLVVPFKFIGEVYGNRFINNKPDVIAIQGEERKTDAVVDNQGVPYWFLKSHTWWECKMRSTDYTYCPTLTVEPGVKIFFHDSCGLYLQQRSKIIAIGKPDSMIVFTALDTTKHWRGIHLNNGYAVDTSRFEYCEVSYGGRPWGSEPKGNIALADNKEAFILKNCLIARSKTYGIGDAHLFETDTCISIVQNNIFYANDSFPLIVSTTELGECRNNQFIDNRYNAILIRGGGDITKSLSIQNQGVPYVIDCWFVVDNLLEIKKGNILQFKGQRAWFKPNSILKSTGVMFTAYDTVWWGMKFDNCRADTSVLDSCIFEKAKYYGGVWPRGAIDVAGSWVRISNSVIVNNECGIYVSGGPSRLTLTNNLISQNRDGIGAFNDIKADSLRIKYNDFLGNKCAFTTLFIYPYLGADSNWWGDKTGPWDPSTKAPDYNPQGRGDSIGDYVIYRPWLSSPVQPPVITILQPNGGEVLYGGELYQIKWKLGDKETIQIPKSPKYLNEWSKAIEGNSEQLKAHGESRDIKGNQGAPRAGILRQELYYTTDFPEGGTKAESFWRFIDTVPGGESSYVWQVPNTPSTRCRVAIKIYYDGGKVQISSTKSFTPLDSKHLTGQANSKFQNPNTPLPSPFKGEGINDYEMLKQVQHDRLKYEIASPPYEVAARNDNNHKSAVSSNPPISPFGKGGIGFDEYESDGMNMVTVDISDANFTIALTTDFNKSTAYNNGRKIVSSPTGNKVYFVYTNEGIAVPGGIYSCYSQDTGKTFGMPDMVSDGGFHPALGLCQSNNPCASWSSGSNLAYTYWTSSWGPPDTIVLPVVNISPPSMVCDDKDTVHIVFAQYYELPSDIGDLIYIKFKRTNFGGAIIETLFTNTFCVMPSIAIDVPRHVHILWQGDGCVCYLSKGTRVAEYQVMRDGHRPSDPSYSVADGRYIVDTLYTTNTNERFYPVIDIYGNQIVAVWQDKDATGNLEIFSRRKIDTGWHEIKNVSRTSGNSKFPTIAGAHYCLWQDNSAGNREVYMSEYVDTIGTWKDAINISNSPLSSSYPHCAYSLVNASSAKLFCLWTEGDTIPYTIKFKKLDVSPVAKIFTDLGQPVQSLYCLNRDGYWIFGSKPYQTTDWGYENLRYKFTGLDPQKEYRLDLAYYFENSQKTLKNDNTEDTEVSIKSDTEDDMEKHGVCSDLIYQTENEILRSTQNDNRLQDGTEVSNPIDVASSFNWTEEKVRPSKDGPYKPNRPERLDRRKKPDRPDRPDKPDGIGRVIQALVVDGVVLDTAFITPNKLIRKSVILPQITYADGEISSEIIKIKGKRVVCAEIGLFEFPGEEKIVKASGPMGQEARISESFFFEKIYPNPTKGVLRIRFNSPDERKVTIKLYDVLGRLVEKVFDDKAKTGMNEIAIRERCFPLGVYFVLVESTGYSTVEKIILLK